MKPLLLSILFATTISAVAQNPEDIKSIKSLCGCFEVTFMYSETFSPDTSYKFHDKYRAKGLEYVVAEESSPTRFVLQHLLLAGDDIIKHWREDWSYQNTDQLVFDHDARWKPSKLSSAQVAGKWTQSVWEVDDAPRYTGTATWVHLDGKNYWQNVADAPLPRREYTKRKDYNVLRRGNKVIITDSGWVHEQDNDKIIRKEGSSDMLLAMEKGYNIYKKVDDTRCTAAKTWWSNNRAYWNTVRKSWDKILKDRSVVKLKQKVNDRQLWQYLTDTQNEYNHETVSAAELPAKVSGIITKFVQ